MGFIPIPEPTPEEFAELLKRYYSIGGFRSAQKLKKGFANSLYKVSTTRGDYVLKITVRHTPAQVKYEIDVLTRLQNLPVPKPILAKNGKYLIPLKGRKCFIYPFLPGREQKVFTPGMLRQVGEFLGKLHLQVEGFKSKIKRVEYYANPPQRLKRVISRRHLYRHPKILRAIDYLERCALSYPLSPKLPQGAMHIDVKPENVLFSGNRLTGVVDFDNSYIGPLVYDFADTIMWFCSKKGRFDMAKAKIIYSGYQRVRKFTPLERREFFNSLHRVYLALSLCCIDLLEQGKLPEYFIVWLVDNLLDTEKNLKVTPAEFAKIFS